MKIHRASPQLQTAGARGSQRISNGGWRAKPWETPAFLSLSVRWQPHHVLWRPCCARHWLCLCQL